MASSPQSARKTRETVKTHAEVIVGLVDKHNSLTRDTHEAITRLTSAIKADRAAFLARNLSGRLKFLFTGK